MNPVVHLADGRVQGSLENGVAVFRGIPYAAAPFGANRFQAPISPAPWDGVRDARSFGPTAPKPVWPADDLLPDPQIEGDDCLNLNVWTPSTEERGLPVLVWIHGGGFTFGSGAVSGYDGSAFARDGVVCVTINYRLGADGFALIEGRPANRGILDQIAALDWVKKNIAAFGGDPAQVTIAGQSAGAMCVVSLMAMPGAKGLFHQAIAQSGAGHHALTSETADEVTHLLAADLGVESTAGGLGSVPRDALCAAQVSLTQRVVQDGDASRWAAMKSSMLALQPVIDGIALSARPVDQIADGQSADVRLLIGATANESTLLAVPTGLYDVLDQQALESLLATLGVDSAITDAYRETYGEMTAADTWVAIHSDHEFRIPAIRVAQARASASAPTFVYEFAWRSPAYGGRLGAAHMLEIPFVFDNLAIGWGAALRGSSAPQSLADAMHGAWVAFVKTGNPGWPEYGTDRAIARFSAHEPEVVHDVDDAVRTAWTGVW